MKAFAIAVALIAAIIVVYLAPVSARTSDSVEVRITARSLSDGRIEFGLQERADRSSGWSDRKLPTRRFFPASGREGRWLGSSPIQLTLPARTAPTPARPTVGLRETVAVGRLDAVVESITRRDLQIGDEFLTRVEVRFTNARGEHGSRWGPESASWGQVAALDARGFAVRPVDACHRLGRSSLETGCPEVLESTNLRPGESVRGSIYFGESANYPLEFVLFSRLGEPVETLSGLRRQSEPVETMVDLPIPPAAPEKVRVPARVLSLDLVIVGPEPLEYFADIRTAQPDGCHVFGGWSLERDGSRIAIDVWNTKPQPDDSGYLACPHGPPSGGFVPSPAISSRGRAETFATIPLGRDFDPGASYDVVLNADDLDGIEYRFVARAFPAPSAEVRIVARRHDDGRVEFGLQERRADGSWGDRVLPVKRFFPSGGSRGVWLSSTPIAVDILPIAERLRDH